MTASTTAADRTVAYASPDTRRSRPVFLIQSWLACGAAMLFCVGTAVFVDFDRLWFMHVFADFHLVVSVATQAVFDLPGYAVIGLGVAAAAGLLGLQLLWRNKHTATMLHILAVAGCCLVFVVYRELMWGTFATLWAAMSGFGAGYGGRGGPHP